MNPEQNQNAADKRRVPWPLIGVVVVIIAPVVVALFWTPSRFMNYGELIQPPRPVQGLDLRSPTGEAHALARFAGKWLLVSFAGPTCGRDCQGSLHKMRQVRLAQGKHLGRVQTALIVLPGKPEGQSPATRGANPNLSLLYVQEGAVETVRRQFDPGPGRIYIVDPLGNLMMRYDSDAEPTGIHKDLARLLRASRIG